jgi:hypothetical protein
MKRFDYGEGDDFQDENYFSDMNEDSPIEITQEEYINLLKRRDLIDTLHVNFMYYKLNQKLLFRAIKLLEQNFSWKFKSQTTKLKLISETYKQFKKLIEIGE